MSFLMSSLDKVFSPIRAAGSGLESCGIGQEGDNKEIGDMELEAV